MKSRRQSLLTCLLVGLLLAFECSLGRSASQGPFRASEIVVFNETGATFTACLVRWKDFDLRFGALEDKGHKSRGFNRPFPIVVPPVEVSWKEGDVARKIVIGEKEFEAAMRPGRSKLIFRLKPKEVAVEASKGD